MVIVNGESYRFVTKFLSKPAKSGPKYFFNIPLAYILNQNIDPNEEYLVLVLTKKELEKIPK